MLLIMAVVTVGAQSWTKKAAKAVFTLKTFDNDGTLMASSNGFFVGENGEAVSNFTPFRGAARAVVIDAQDKEWPVECIMGANDMYDVARFKVAAKKTTALPLAAAVADEGSAVWLLTYHNTKAATQGLVRRAEMFQQDYVYYTVAMTAGDNTTGCPLVNANGEAIGLMQTAAKDGDTLVYAVSARFADSLKITGLSLSDATLRSTAIKKDLPEKLEQAQLMMFVASTGVDSAQYAVMVDDFIKKFPTEPDGYMYRAQLLTEGRKFDDAAKDMEQAVSVAKNKDEVHYSYSRLIYQKELLMPDAQYDGWSLDKALDEARKAEKDNPLDVYRYQQAQVLYAQKKYDEAYDVYATIMSGSMKSAELFGEALRCKQQVGDSTAVLALLDSCVAMFSKPYLKEAAPYLYQRARTVIDYGRRRQYQQALNDLDDLIALFPRNDLYYSEKASLLVRVGYYDEAIEIARQCIEVAPQHSDGYLFMGLAQCLKGDKAEGVKNLEKAKQLGDEQATELIEKYGK